jgi:hypothetical protein
MGNKRKVCATIKISKKKKKKEKRMHRMEGHS